MFDWGFYREFTKKWKIISIAKDFTKIMNVNSIIVQFIWI